MAKLELPPIYPITASSGTTATDHVAQVREFLSAGVYVFQVREKQMDDRAFCSLLLQIRQVCDQASAQFIINDRIDLATGIQRLQDRFFQSLMTNGVTIIDPANTYGNTFFIYMWKTFNLALLSPILLPAV